MTASSSASGFPSTAGAQPGAFHFTNKSSSSAGQAHRELAADIIDSLSKLRFSGSRPEIRLEISGDLADPSTIRIAPISIQSGPIIGPTWRIEGVQAQANFANQILTIPQLQIQGTDGSLNLSGRLESGQFEFELASSMSPKPLMGLFPKTSFARNLVFQEAPQFTVSGTVDVKNPAASFLTGSLRAGKFTVKGAKVDTLAADFAWRDGQFFARDVQLWMNGAELIADVLFSPGDFRLRMTNSIPPTLFAPLLGPKEQEFLKQMEFKDNPYVQIEVQGSKPDFASVTGTGTMKLGRTAMRGAWFDSAEAKLEIANRAVSYKDFIIKGRGGTGTGVFVYDFGGQQVRLQNINSSLFPVDVLMWADPKIAEALKPYRFTKAPRVQGGGVISLKDPSGNNLALKLQADGFDYDLLARTLHFGRTTGTVNVVGSKVLVKIAGAKLMDGEAALDANVSTSPSDPTVTANVTVKRVDFAKLTKLYFNYDTSQGVASGTYKFTMRGGLAETMKGEGSLRVEDGKVFAIPFLGPFSDILDKIIPGSGYESAHLATADFRISDGKIFTDNLVIQGFGFNLIGSGDIGFLVDKMNLSVRINAKGVPGIVLFPVSKLFEYVSTGSFADPQWRPKIIPASTVETPGMQRKSRRRQGRVRLLKRATAATIVTAASAEKLLHQKNRTSTLDLTGDLAVKAGGHTGDAAGNDLAAFGNEALQELRVLVIDRLLGKIRTTARHRAIRAAEIGAAFGRFRLHDVLLDFPMQGVPAQIRVVLLLLETTRSAGALLVTSGDVAGNGLALRLGLGALEGDDFLWHGD